MASLHPVLDTGSVDARIRHLTHSSSTREKIFEHLFLADLGLELIARGVDHDVLRSEIDKNGYDVVIEAGGIIRHIQLKVAVSGGARADISVNLKLACQQSGCIVWLGFDPARRSFDSIRWFGDRPGLPLPDAGDKIARHSRGNASGIKAERPWHRIIPQRRFETLEDMAHLADRLFGMLPADPIEFLRSRTMPIDSPLPKSEWAAALAAGAFASIPADLDWNSSGIIADMIDGYRLVEAAGLGEYAGFLARQNNGRDATGMWPGGPVELWATLFLQHRAARSGAFDFAEPDTIAQLDQLVQQLRTSLIELTDAR